MQKAFSIGSASDDYMAYWDSFPASLFIWWN